MDTEELALKAKKGDRNAFAELIYARKTVLYKTAYAYVKNREDALDIVNETVYKAFVSVKKLENPAYFNTWLTRILINHSLNYLRKNKHVVLCDNERQYKNVRPEGMDEEVLDLYQAIDRLEEKYKTVVILKYIQDLKLDQIAEILRWPIGTVKSCLHRAVKELRVDMRGEGCINE